MENWPFLSRLNQLCDSNELCSVYTDPKKPYASIEGFVDFVSHEYFVVRVVNEHGFHSGFALRSLEDVYRVEVGGQYEKKIENLFRGRQQCHPPFLPPLDVSSDLLREFLLAAKRHELLVGVVILAQERRDGWVEEISDGVLHVKLVDNYGNDDGSCMVDLETIDKINCDTIDLQDQKILARWHETDPPL